MSPTETSNTPVGANGWFKPAAIVLGTTAAGMVIGVLLHYMLYRFSLPVQPFIYVAF